MRSTSERAFWTRLLLLALTAVVSALLSGTASPSLRFIPISSAQTLSSTAPAARRITTTRPLAEVEQERHRADAELEQILNDPQRGKWTVLPAWVRGVWFDQRGKVWFVTSSVPYAPPEEEELAFRDALAGKTRVLRSYQICLIDSKGRIWRSGDDVESFDGTRTRTFAFTPPPNPNPPKESLQGRFHGPHIWPMEVALEDSAGNCWFAGSDYYASGISVGRVSPDGTWTQFRLDDPYTREPSNPFNQFQFIEQPGGKIILVFPIGSVPGKPLERDADIHAYRFDGKTWSRINPHFCDHPLSHVIPQEDGSIKCVCEGGRVWTYWPDDMLDQVRQRVQTWFSSLDDPDATKRQDAMRGLLTVGPQLNTLLPEQDDQKLRPSTRAIMRNIRQNYEKMALVDKDGLHSELASYDTGVEVGAAMAIAGTRGAGVALVAAPIRLAEKEDPLPLGLLWIDSTGKCTVKPAPEGRFVRPYAGGGSPRNGWCDAAGNLWRIEGRRTDDNQLVRMFTRRSPDGSYLHSFPPGAVASEIYGEDQDGRLYFALSSRGRVVMYDAKREDSRDWRFKSVDDVVINAVAPDGRTAWTLSDSRPDKTHIAQLTPGGLKDLALPPQAKGRYDLVPLKQGKVILVPFDGSGGPVFLSDGMYWSVAADVPTLVEQQVRRMMSLVPDAMGVNLYATRLAASVADDGTPTGLWLLPARPRPRPPATRPATAQALGPASNSAASPASLPAGAVPVPPQVVEYFDGTRWHDVNADLAALKPPLRGELVTLGYRGRAAVFRASAREWLWVSYGPEGQIHVTSSQLQGQVTVSPVSTRSVGDPSGGVWITSDTANARTVFFNAGHAEFLLEDGHSLPQLLDREGRVWFTEAKSNTLRVRVKGQDYQATLPSIEANARMLEGPDGRIWLLQLDALVEVSVVEEAGSPAIKLTRYVWDGPKEELQSSFIDPANGLWLRDASRRLARYVLPKKGEAGGRQMPE